MIWLVACEYSGRVRDVPNFPNYLARDDGEIISLTRRKPFVMKRRPHRSGYVLATLTAEGKQVTSVAHRFIAMAWHPNPNDLPCVRHLDGDKQNNAPGNLAWGSYSENENDKILHGRKRYGTSKMKLNSKSRAEVRKMFASGMARKDIAEHFSVNRSTISRLISGATWDNRKWPMALQAEAR